MRKDTRVKINKAYTPMSERDVPVEVKQALSVTELFAAMVSGYDLPQKYSNGYDEDITIDEVGYSAQDTLDGMDYLKAVNQRVNIANMQAAQSAAIDNNTVIPTSDENVEE